jgi:hypothetical protein
MNRAISKFSGLEFQCIFGFIILVLIFILSKWEALFLPFFWDEAWSYLPALEAMSNTTPCLTPNCIDSELYRGHPLFFYFIASFWAKIMGKSVFSYHVFALILSIFTLITFYKVSQKVFNPQLALACCALLVCQEIFIVQSTFVLPEILIMGLTMGMYGAYASNQKWMYIIWGTVLCLTKESGIIITLCFVLSALFSNYSSKNGRNLMTQWWLICPLVSIILFLLYQKSILGWYFFPLHSSMIESEIGPIFQKIKMIWSFLFFEQGRQFITLILSVSMVFILSKKAIIASNYLNLAVVCGLFTIELITFFYLKNQQFYACFPFFTLVFIFLRPSKREIETQPLQVFSVIFFIIYTLFTAMNFYMIRYLLVLLPFVILLFVMLFHKIRLFSTPFLLPFLLVSLGLNFGIVYKKDSAKEWIDDVSLNYKGMVMVHQKAIEYCEANNWYNQDIYTHFLMGFNLKLPFLHYLRSDKKFNRVNTEGPLQDNDIVIFSSIEYNESLYNQVNTAKNYRLSQRFQEGSAWCEIYEKKALR